MGQNIGTGGRAWGKILGWCEEYTGVSLIDSETTPKFAIFKLLELACYSHLSLFIITITLSLKVSETTPKLAIFEAAPCTASMGWKYLLVRLGLIFDRDYVKN